MYRSPKAIETYLARTIRGVQSRNPPGGFGLMGGFRRPSEESEPRRRLRRLHVDMWVRVIAGQPYCRAQKTSDVHAIYALVPFELYH